MNDLEKTIRRINWIVYPNRVIDCDTNKGLSATHPKEVTLEDILLALRFIGYKVINSVFGETCVTIYVGNNKYWDAFVWVYNMSLKNQTLACQSNIIKIFN